jgi:hypothetical protein
MTSSLTKTAMAIRTNSNMMRSLEELLEHGGQPCDHLKRLCYEAVQAHKMGRLDPHLLNNFITVAHGAETPAQRAEALAHWHPRLSAHIKDAA